MDICSYLILFFATRHKNKYTQRHYRYRFTKVGTMIIKNNEQYQNSLNYLHKFAQLKLQNVQLLLYRCKQFLC